jgi:hypothetical protein
MSDRILCPICKFVMRDWEPIKVYKNGYAHEECLKKKGKK